MNVHICTRVVPTTIFEIFLCCDMDIFVAVHIYWLRNNGINKQLFPSSCNVNVCHFYTNPINFLYCVPLNNIMHTISVRSYFVGSKGLVKSTK